MKIINIKDKQTKILVLDGGEYIINGQKYSLPNSWNNKIEITELKELKKINITTITIAYFNEIKQKQITVEEYMQIKKELEDKRIVNDYGELEFENLDDEYNYKKFIQNCKPICKTIETISDNLEPAEEIEIIYDTGNKYIKCNYFTEKNKKPFLYYYDREQALKDIVENKFKELGFEFAENCNCKATKYKNCSGITESLEKCIKHYEVDKEDIENTIMRKYNEEYAKIEKDKLMALPKLVNDLEYRLNGIHTYKTSSNNYWNAKKIVQEIQELINESFK